MILLHHLAISPRGHFGCVLVDVVVGVDVWKVEVNLVVVNGVVDLIVVGIIVVVVAVVVVSMADVVVVR